MYLHFALIKTQSTQKTCHFLFFPMNRKRSTSFCKITSRSQVVDLIHSILTKLNFNITYVTRENRPRSPSSSKWKQVSVLQGKKPIHPTNSVNWCKKSFSSTKGHTEHLSMLISITHFSSSTISSWFKNTLQAHNLRWGHTEAVLHTSNIKAHSSYQCCINQGQDLAQPGISRHLHQQFLHFLLAFSKTMEKDPMQIQLYSSRT